MRNQSRGSKAPIEAFRHLIANVIMMKEMEYIAEVKVNVWAGSNDRVIADA